MRFDERLRRLTIAQKATAGVAAAVVLVGGSVAGYALAGNRSRHVAAAPTPSQTATPTPTPTRTTPKPTHKPKPKPKAKPKPVNPLTGLGPPVAGPAVAVKIGDTANGRPQAGIDQADVVYVEQVEGGLTRLLAIFDTHKPTVGPVRSVRADNPELLAQYGPIDFAASGGSAGELAPLRASNLKADLAETGFFRDGSRSAPYNLMVNLAQLPASLGGSAAKSIGWTWSASTARLAGAKPGATVHTTVGGTPVDFQWDPASKRYVRVIDGTPQHAADGAPVATPNVIVQTCQGHPDPTDIDQAGNPAFYTESVGHGAVSVFRDGKRVDGTWSRPSRASGTTLRDTKGHRIALAPGGAWVVLVVKGTAVASS